MKTFRKHLLNQFEKIHQRLHLEVFRHVARDNAFGMEYNYLAAPASRRAREGRPLSQAESA